MKAGLLVIGTLCDLAGLILVMLIAKMFQHPRGIGTEKMMGPFLILIAVCLFAASGACFLLFARKKARTNGQ